MEMIPIVGIISSTLMVVFIVYFVTQARARRAQAQVDMQARLIDRFGSSAELVQFLQSPAGREFVQGVHSAPAALMRDRLMSGFTRSIILIALGSAFLFLAFMTDEGELYIPASILLFLGVGYLIATFVSYKLSAKLMAGEARSES